MLPEGFASFAGGAAEVTSWLTGRKGKLTRESVKYACMDRWYSCEKLKGRLGYVPLVGMGEALERSVRSFVGEEREAKRREGEKKGQ